MRGRFDLVVTLICSVGLALGWGCATPECGEGTRSVGGRCVVAGIATGGSDASFSADGGTDSGGGALGCDAGSDTGGAHRPDAGPTPVVGAECDPNFFVPMCGEAGPLACDRGRVTETGCIDDMRCFDALNGPICLPADAQPCDPCAFEPLCESVPALMAVNCDADTGYAARQACDGFGTHPVCGVQDGVAACSYGNTGVEIEGPCDPSNDGKISSCTADGRIRACISEAEGHGYVWTTSSCADRGDGWVCYGDSDGGNCGPPGLEECNIPTFEGECGPPACPTCPSTFSVCLGFVEHRSCASGQQCALVTYPGDAVPRPVCSTPGARSCDLHTYRAYCSGESTVVECVPSGLSGEVHEEDCTRGGTQDFVCIDGAEHMPYCEHRVGS